MSATGNEGLQDELCVRPGDRRCRSVAAVAERRWSRATSSCRSPERAAASLRIAAANSLTVRCGEQGGEVNRASHQCNGGMPHRIGRMRTDSAQLDTTRPSANVNSSSAPTVVTGADRCRQRGPPSDLPADPTSWFLPAGNHEWATVV